MTQTWMAGLVVQGRPCLVVGDDHEADDKAARLTAAGADVTRVGADFDPDSHLAPTPFVVIFTPRDEDRAARLFARAERERFLLCAIDQPRYCTVTNVALVELGEVTLGLGSNGKVPALLKRMKEALGRGLASTIVPLSRSLAALREVTPPHDRRRVMNEALEGFSIDVTVTLPKPRS